MMNKKDFIEFCFVDCNVPSCRFFMHDIDDINEICDWGHCRLKNVLIGKQGCLSMEDRKRKE